MSQAEVSILLFSIAAAFLVLTVIDYLFEERK